MATPFVVNPDVPNYMQVMGHHVTAHAAIGLHFSESNPDNADLSRKELETLRAACLQVQQHRDMMALLAFLEACFRLDYASRKRLNLKDGLSKVLTKLFNRKRNKAALMDDIVKAWLQQGVLTHHQYDRINSAFQLRHWIAHGQYWSPAKIKPHDLWEVTEFVESLVNARLFQSDGIDLAGA
ncbi:hypothetical protein FJU31_09915 [Stenotrophomonas cyclobalanopsidis]|uniref:DUF4145 domain-containing protein n=1 Tax=Stenotrophomonas cyclobalanopsidis TaxID=2771362 RepID=A0ABQ6T0Y3_9GAMM|nr:hypothetical protein [Stenotrophomonas cyclobalanopsidis]KAA8998707.1 hypothetical protein FJU31_09915 [Stenotrophomonas cyclobalanopsidis]